MHEVINNLEWQKYGSLYGAVVGYDPTTEKKVYIYNTQPLLPNRGELMRLGDALIINNNAKYDLIFLKVRGKRVRKVTGAACLWFGSSFTLDLSEFNSLIIIIILEGASSLVEIEDGNSVYTLDVESGIEYPNLSIDGYNKLIEQ